MAGDGSGTEKRREAVTFPAIEIDFKATWFVERTEGSFAFLWAEVVVIVSNIGQDIHAPAAIWRPT